MEREHKYKCLLLGFDQRKWCVSVQWFGLKLKLQPQGSMWRERVCMCWTLTHDTVPSENWLFGKQVCGESHASR